MIILDNLRFASISFQVYLGYLSIVCCICFTKLLQVASRVSLGRRFEEESFLEALTYSKPISFAIHFSAVISCGFQLLFQYWKGHKIIFYKSYLLAGKFLCLHRNFPSLFGCFAAYISKVLLADITGQRHIFGALAAQSTREASRLTILGLG